MLEKLRQHLTYANVTATLALFIALGGSSYAALRVSSREIADNSIRSRDVHNHTLTRHDLARNTLDGSVIRESRLGRVPRAALADNADRLGGLTAADLKLKCPPDTLPIAGICAEPQPRPAVAYGTAAEQCSRVGNPPGAGRRLPTHGELIAALQGFDLAPGGELTGEVYPSASTPGEVDALYVTTQGGSVALTPDTDAGKKAFRCVFDPVELSAPWTTTSHDRRRGLRHPVRVVAPRHPRLGRGAAMTARESAVLVPQPPLGRPAGDRLDAAGAGLPRVLARVARG